MLIGFALFASLHPDFAGFPSNLASCVLRLPLPLGAIRHSVAELLPSE